MTLLSAAAEEYGVQRRDVASSRRVEEVDLLAPHRLGRADFPHVDTDSGCRVPGVFPFDGSDDMVVPSVPEPFLRIAPSQAPPVVPCHCCKGKVSGF
jgi:hypothetical protein